MIYPMCPEAVAAAAADEWVQFANSSLGNQHLPIERWGFFCRVVIGTITHCFFLYSVLVTADVAAHGAVAGAVHFREILVLPQQTCKQRARLLVLEISCRNNSSELK